MNLAPPLQTPSGLAPGNLTLAKEKTYFVFVLVISILLWLALALTIVGMFYAVMIGIFLWLANGLLTAQLRAEAVQVSERQLPELHATFLEVCQRLGVAHPPRLYVLQSGGLLNAFATRHAGRDFVVVYSDFLEALGTSSPEMKFVLGHELGHIQSRHILKQIFLAPGLFFPLAGPAYRRAWESSCDRFGAFAAQEVNGALRAMLTISGGREHGRRLDPDCFAEQLTTERGFFVSLHELTSSYPTLSRRTRDLRALATGERSDSPPRNPLAYLFALLVPGGNVGGGGAAGMMIMVVFVGMLAAMAIPSFQKVRLNALEKACANNQRMIGSAVDQYQLEQGKPPAHIEDFSGPGKHLASFPKCPSGGAYEVIPAEETGGKIICSIHGEHSY